MKKILTITCLLFLGVTSAFSQSGSLIKAELIDTNTIFNVHQATIMGFDEASSPKRLIYQFMHPSGGIQVQRGSFFSGGKTPENLHAYGSLALGETLDVKNNKIQWFAHRSGGTNVNFYAKPLTSAINISNENMIAKNGDIISYKQFATNVKELKKSSPLFEFIEMEESSEEKAAPHYIDNYQITEVKFGMSGKISHLYLFDYRLKPEGERNKGLIGLPYKMKTKTNKDNTKMAFGDKNIMYKGAMLGKVAQLNDPVSGNAVVFGGLKYKKDKSKNNSHFYELMLLAFDKQGAIINKEKYETKVPLAVESVYPIYGKNLAPDVDEITHGIFILKGAGNKKTSNINRKIRRVIVVDMSTGKIIAKDEVEFKSSGTSLIKRRDLAGNKIELTYYYTTKGNIGLVIMTVGPTGIVSIKEVDGNTEAFKAIGLADKFYSSLKLEAVNSYAVSDGSRIDVVEFVTIKKSNNITTRRSEGYAFVKYDTENNFVGLHGIGRLLKGENMDVLKLEGDELWFVVSERAENKASRMKFITLNKLTFEVKMATVPEYEPIKGKTSYFYDAAAAKVYFLTQKRPGKGLSIYVYEM